MSVSERLSDKIEATKLAVMERDNWTCVVEGCGRSATHLGHILPNDGIHLKRFGDEIVNHPQNMRAVCCLAHNHAVQVTYKGHPVAAEAQAQMVREAIKRGKI